MLVLAVFTCREALRHYSQHHPHHPRNPGVAQTLASPRWPRPPRSRSIPSGSPWPALTCRLSTNLPNSDGGQTSTKAVVAPVPFHRPDHPCPHRLTATKTHLDPLPLAALLPLSAIPWPSPLPSLALLSSILGGSWICRGNRFPCSAQPVRINRKRCCDVKHRRAKRTLFQSGLQAPMLLAEAHVQSCKTPHEWVATAVRPIRLALFHKRALRPGLMHM